MKIERIIDFNKELDSQLIMYLKLLVEQRMKRSCKLDKNIHYQIKQSNGRTLQIKLAQSITKRKTPNTRDEYDVLSDKICGEGKFGKVIDVIGTFTLDKKIGYRFIKNEERYYKLGYKISEFKPTLFKRARATFHNESMRVAEVSNITGGFIISNRSKTESYLPIRLVDGRPLNEINFDKWHVEDRLFMVSHFLTEFLWLHLNDYAHRDVKQENMMWDTEYKDGMFVDLGLTRRIGELANFAGTPIYMPKHYMKKYNSDSEFMAVDRVDQDYDVFAFTCLLVELLGGEDEKVYSHRDLHPDDFQNYPIDISTLFKGLEDDLTKEEQLILKEMISCHLYLKEPTDPLYERSFKYTKQVIDALIAERQIRLYRKFSQLYEEVSDMISIIKLALPYKLNLAEDIKDRAALIKFFDNALATPGDHAILTKYLEKLKTIEVTLGADFLGKLRYFQVYKQCYEEVLAIQSSQVYSKIYKRDKDFNKLSKPHVVSIDEGKVDENVASASADESDKWRLPVDVSDGETQSDDSFEYSDPSSSGEESEETDSGHALCLMI